MIGQKEFHLLVEHVQKAAPRLESNLHGTKHWRCVAWVGQYLLKQTPEADKNLVLLFSLLHDSMRHTDGGDAEHGERAAAFAQSLNGKFYQLSKSEMDTLANACFYHNTGRTSEYPTIGVCWDSDRLNLWRVGTKPNPKLLSTAEAKKPATLAWSRSIPKQYFSWEQIYEAYLDLKS